jgi:predicted ribosomally synthesized peptide with nif11-like leader
MSLATLDAFLEAASVDERLQEQLLAAPDAATLAAIARSAGFPVAEADWLQASGAEPAEQAATAAASAAEAAEPAEALPSDPLTAFLHQAQGDEELRGALTEALDAAEVAAIARAAGYPITTADLWAASGASAEELQPSDPGGEAALGPDDQPSLEAFLRRLERDPALQAALVEAADAAAVAEIAQAAGHPLREADLWRASGLEPQDLHAPPPEPADPLREALTAFLQQAQGDPRLGELLAEAADAAAVAEIAQAVGYPITAADLWAVSAAASEELLA